MSTHYFFAVALSPTAASQIDQWVTKHKTKYPFKSWVHPGDYHITLSFLGHAEAQSLEDLRQRLPQVMKGERSFELELERFATFGMEKQPRVFIADLKKQPALSQLQQKVALACKAAGFVLEKRSYHPHLTIARKWSAGHEFSLPNLAEEMGETVAWEAKEVTLFQTHLDRLPKYEPIAHFPLQMKVSFLGEDNK